MREFLAANPKDKHGVHRYSLEDFGLDPKLERERYRSYTERFGVEILEMRDWRPEDGLPADLAGPLYLSLDLDALDPAFAPGVSHPEPGGLSTRQLLDVLQALPSPLIGADLVELNPLRDPLGLTARVAAKLLKEIAARLLLDSGV